MRILLVEISVAGHHLSYLQTLATHFSKTHEVHVIIPETVPELSNNGIHIYLLSNKEKGKVRNGRWLKKVYSITKTIKFEDGARASFNKVLAL